MQGAGAIAAVVLALTSDLTRENQRTKAMAMIGMTIGLAFMLALIVSPWLEFFNWCPRFVFDDGGIGGAFNDCHH